MAEKKNVELLSKEEREWAVNKIITFFAEERDEQIGIIAGGEVLDFFLKEVGEMIYSKTMKSNKEWFKERMQNIEVDFDLRLDKIDKSNSIR